MNADLQATGDTAAAVVMSSTGPLTLLEHLKTETEYLPTTRKFPSTAVTSVMV